MQCQIWSIAEGQLDKNAVATVRVSDSGPAIISKRTYNRVLSKIKYPYHWRTNCDRCIRVQTKDGVFLSLIISSDIDSKYHFSFLDF